MKTKTAVLLTVASLVAGCAVPKKKEVALPEAEFTRTYGEMSLRSRGSIGLEYKNIALAVDPASAPSNAPSTDYILLTASDDASFPLASRAAFPKNTKIIAPESAFLTRHGFGSVKAIQPGQTILLKKDGGYLFLRSAQSVGDTIVNSYFMEFDAGAKIFITGPLWDADQLRPFLYGLRDEGKNINVLVLMEPDRKPDWDEAVDIIALLQPDSAVVVERGGRESPSLNREKFEKKLVESLYSGGIRYAEAGQSIPF